MTTTQLMPGELSTLTGHELAILLNEIDGEAAEALGEAQKYEQELAKAETVLVYDPSDKKAKADRILYRGLLRNANRRSQAIRQRQSRIQSLMKLCQI